MKLRLTMAILALLIGSAAFAQQAPAPNPRMRNAQKIADYLQLTPDQITAWRQIDKDTAASVRPLMEQVRAARQAANQKKAALLTPEQKSKLDAMRAAAAFMRKPR